MNISQRLLLWKLSRRLRQLQREYYRAAARNDGVIGPYLETLAKARALFHDDAADAAIRVHAGAGGHYIEGWINIDVDPSVPLDLVADAGLSLPFRSSSVDYIHSEDLLEHLPLQRGKAFLTECHRVLRDGGVMRLLTPDLRAIIEKVYLAREPEHVQWCNVYLDARGACESLNMHIRMNGEHEFIYDREYLTSLLNGAGFRVRVVRFNRSADPALRFLDLRDFGLNMFLDCYKP